jgi:hypothetical protein
MHTIGPLERVFIWLGGYTPSNLAVDSRQDREPLCKLGATVLFAAVVAGINWAVGGWVYATALEGAQRHWVTGAAAFMGVFLVLVFDRGLVYVIDTAGYVPRLRLVTFTALRFLVVVAISSLTSQAVMPMLLGSEMNLKALQMQEQAEQRRVTQLGSQFQVASRQDQAKQAIAEVARLQQASQTLPANITTQLASAQRCWLDYNAARRALIDDGVELPEARERLRPKASRCSEAEKTAKALREAYERHTREDLEQAHELQASTQAELQSARSAVDTRVAAARQVETGNLNPRSSTVLWELLSTSPGALGKWLLVTAVLLVCELLPMLYKLQMGQTPPGRRITIENRLHRQLSESDAAQQELALSMKDEVNHASHAGMQAALRQPETQKVFADCFASTLAGMAPLEAVNSMMRDIKMRGSDLGTFQRQYPQYALVVGQAWRNAIEQTMLILSARGAAIKPTAA